MAEKRRIGIALARWLRGGYYFYRIKGWLKGFR
jgi:hypothetical protein